MNELARLRLSQDEERLAFLYLDGHIRAYSGQAELAKAKKAQRSVATCAATDTWLHDADGAPLLVVTSEMNAGLTQVLEAIVTGAKELVPAGQRLTVSVWTTISSDCPAGRLRTGRPGVSNPSPTLA